MTPSMNAHNEQHVIEQIAQQWDGCMYDSVGETIDIGDAIRAAGKRLSSQPAAAQEAVAISRAAVEGAMIEAGAQQKKPSLWTVTTRELVQVVNTLHAAAPVAAAQVDAPSIESAHAMGAKGAPANDAERLAFEAWMRGHCWALCATWDGAGYRSDAEQGGGYCPNAARTRMLWAAWRDRAALASTPAAPGIDLAAMIRSNLRSIRSMANSLPKSFALVSSNIGHEIDHAMTLLDASPKGALNEQFGSAEGLGTGEVLRVADHMAQAIDYIGKRYPDAAMLDRGPILRNIRRWEQRLRAALADSPKGVSEAVPSAWISDNDMLKLRDSIDEARNIRMSSERTHLRVHPVFIPAMQVPVRDAADRCESGSPECGPVKHWDSDGVPLCAKCWAKLPRLAGDAEAQP